MLSLPLPVEVTVRNRKSQSLAEVPDALVVADAVLAVAVAVAEPCQTKIGECSCRKLNQGDKQDTNLSVPPRPVSVLCAITCTPVAFE